MKSIRKAYRGEKGFTLVELLVVVVILGILAAVAAVAIMRFMSAGNVSAANEELHQVKTAIAACMFDGNSASINGTTFPIKWDGSTGKVVSGTADAASYIDGKLTGAYDVQADGTVTTGYVTGGISGKSWGSHVAWSATTGGFVKV